MSRLAMETAQEQVVAIAPQSMGRTKVARAGSRHGRESWRPARRAGRCARSGRGPECAGGGGGHVLVRTWRGFRGWCDQGATSAPLKVRFGYDAQSQSRPHVSELDGSGPLYAQPTRALIPSWPAASGGARLPPRVLARARIDLRATVLAAYEQLHAEGIHHQAGSAAMSLRSRPRARNARHRGRRPAAWLRATPAVPARCTGPHHSWAPVPRPALQPAVRSAAHQSGPDYAWRRALAHAAAHAEMDCPIRRA